MFSLHGLPFHLWSLMVKLGPVSSNKSGREFLWVLVVKSKQPLAILHPSLHCLGLRSFETQSVQISFIFKSLWVIAWIVAWQRDVANCSLSIATRLFSWCQRDTTQLTMCGLLLCGLDWFPAWQFYAHCCNFPPIETFCYDMWQLLHIRLPGDTPFFQNNIVIHLCSRHYLPLCTIAHHWLARSPLKNGTYASLCYRI